MTNDELKNQVYRLALTLGRRALIFWFLLVLLGIGLLALQLLSAVHVVAKLTAVSLLLAYVLFPAVNYLSDKRKINRIASIVLVYASVALVMALTLAYILPVLHRQFTDFWGTLRFFAGNLQQNLDDLLLKAKANAPPFLQDPLNDLDPQAVQLPHLLKEFQESAPTWLGSTFSSVFSGFKAAAGALATTVLVPLFTFYILMDSRKYSEGFLRLFPSRWKPDVRSLLNEIDLVLGNYIRGQLMVCFTVGVSIAIVLSLLGVPYSILIGVFAGVVDIIPYVGVAIGMIPAALIALGVKGPLFALVVVIAMEVVHWSEGHIIVPAIIGHSVGLPPLVVMIALGMGAELGGVMGMFLSMPIAAILRVLMLFYVRKLEGSELATTPIEEDSPSPAELVLETEFPVSEEAIPANAGVLVLDGGQERTAESANGLTAAGGSQTSAP